MTPIVVAAPMVVRPDVRRSTTTAANRSDERAIIEKA